MNAAFKLADDPPSAQLALSQSLAHCIDSDRAIAAELLPAELRLIACITVLAPAEGAGSTPDEVRIEAVTEFDGAPLRTIISLTVDDGATALSDTDIRARYQAVIEADGADCLVTCMLAATRNRADAARAAGGWDGILTFETFASKLVTRSFSHNAIAMRLVSQAMSTGLVPRTGRTSFWGNYRGYLQDRFPDIAVHVPHTSATRRPTLPSLFCDVYDRVADPVRSKIRFVHAPEGSVAVVFRDASFRAVKRVFGLDRSEDRSSFSMDRRMRGFRVQVPALLPDEPFEPQEPAIDAAIETARRMRFIVEDQFAAVERLIA